MAREKWKVDAENFDAVWQYVYRNKPELQLVLSAIIKPEQLQAVLADDLTPVEIRRLRTSIRVDKTRSKKEQLNLKDVQVTLSPEAHKVLALLAKSREVTYSEAIERYLGALQKMPYDQAEDLVDDWS